MNRPISDSTLLLPTFEQERTIGKSLVEAEHHYQTKYVRYIGSYHLWKRTMYGIPPVVVVLFSIGIFLIFQPQTMSLMLIPVVGATVFAIRTYSVMVRLEEELWGIGNLMMDLQNERLGLIKRRKQIRNQK